MVSFLTNPHSAELVRHNLTVSQRPHISSCYLVTCFSQEDAIPQALSQRPVSYRRQTESWSALRNVNVRSQTVVPP
jgi:hypothetical protein